MTSKQRSKNWYNKNKGNEKFLEHVAHNAKVRRAKIKQWWKGFKTQFKCNRCSETHPATLDFHHKDPSTKEYCVGVMVENGMSKERILNEVSKCEVLCANCHRKEHYGHYYAR